MQAWTQAPPAKLRAGRLVLACTFALWASVSAAASGPNGEAEADVDAARFNSAFLAGAAGQQLDLSVFSRGNPVIAGQYRVDVYVNGSWKGRRDLDFQADDDGQPNACLSLSVLEELGVDSAVVLESVEAEGTSCRVIGDWIEGARAQFDSAELRYELSVPQAFLRHTPRGYVSPALWDTGINAGYVGYHFNAIDSRSRTGGDWSNNRTAYLGLNTGLNIGGWQFRHDSSLSWSEDGGSDWDSIATYVQRPLAAVRGVLTLGDAHTSGELFDSIAYRGISLVSDDRMLPDSLRGYAPVVRGIAETSAVVEIRQNSQLIHSVTVAPGSFVIDDLYPTGYGGDLEVTVLEADGRRRSFNVPYGSVAQMLRPGSARYAVTAGRVRNPSLLDEPTMLQATYQRGLTNHVTLYAGTAATEDYASMLYGAGLSTPVGAFAVDATHARAELRDGDRRTGSSVRLGYSNLIGATGTNVTVAAYRYSTREFLGLQDAIRVQDLIGRGTDPEQLLRQRSQFQLTLNQPLGEGRGAMYLTGSLREFWGEHESARDFQFGYNNAWGRVNYGISAMRTFEPVGGADTRYLLSFSLPLGRSGNPVSLNSDLGLGRDGYENSRVGIAGSLGQDHALSYGLAVSDSDDAGTGVVATADYRSPVAAINGAYSHADDYRQASVGASGTVVLHAGGATFAPQRGDTMVLVEAPGALGAQVQNAPGVRVDGRGYALVPYVSPYRLNTVTLDPQGMARDVELQSTSATIAPYAGAISRLRFDTRHGRALLVRASQATGEPLPFGAQVFDEAGQVVGTVGQGGVAYLRTEAEAATLAVRWGDAADQQCHFDVRVPALAGSGTAGSEPDVFTRVEATCR